MPDDPKAPADDRPRDVPDPKLIPDVEDADKAAENIEEKGEPFDGNLA